MKIGSRIGDRRQRQGLIGDIDSRGVECRDFKQANGFRGRGGQLYGLGGGKADAAGGGGHCRRDQSRREETMV